MTKDRSQNQTPPDSAARAISSVARRSGQPRRSRWTPSASMKRKNQFRPTLRNDAIDHPPTFLRLGLVATENPSSSASLSRVPIDNPLFPAMNRDIADWGRPIALQMAYRLIPEESTA